MSCPICSAQLGAFRAFKRLEHEEGGFFMLCVRCYCIITKDSYDAARMWERKFRELEEKTQDLDPDADKSYMTNTKHGTAKSGSKEWGSKGRKEDGKRLRKRANQKNLDFARRYMGKGLRNER